LVSKSGLSRYQNQAELKESDKLPGLLKNNKNAKSSAELMNQDFTKAVFSIPEEII